MLQLYSVEASGSLGPYREEPGSDFFAPYGVHCVPMLGNIGSSGVLVQSHKVPLELLYDALLAIIPLPVMLHELKLSLSDSLLLNVCCALVVHKVYNKYEVQPANLLATAFLLVGVPLLPCYFLHAHLLRYIILDTLLSYSLFYGTLVSSIILYRISPIHPLAKYPGPWYLRISKFFTLYHVSGGKQYIFFKNLHDKYGPFVRVGPNEVSVADISAIPPILGLNGMRRGPLWIAQVIPGMAPNIAASRDVNLHEERRKLWARGFTASALKDLQPAVEGRVVELVEELAKRVSPVSGDNETTLDLTQWLSSYTYDVMGDMAFSGGFSLIRKGDENGVKKTLEGYTKVIGILGHIPWMTGLIHKVASFPEDAQRHLDFGARQYDMRKVGGATKRDLFHYITNEDGTDELVVERGQGISDILVAIGAGADTTATVSSGIFFYLLSNPTVFCKLREEVDSAFPIAEGDPFDSVKLAGLPYLNAVINETLRLQPPLPTSLQRSPLEGSGGKMVVGRFIPESASVYVSPYVLHRDPRYFSPFPDSFIPERWMEAGSEKFTTNTSAFIPFSTGPANCVGKNLALLEMRLVVAAIVQKFDIKFAPGYDPTKWEEDLQDFFVYKIGKLPVVLYDRK